MLVKKFESYEKLALTARAFTKNKIGDLDILTLGGLNKHYLSERHLKKRIILHHTAGNIYGDLLTLTQNKLVSTAFLISPTGQIFNLFDWQAWSYHLGKNAVGGNEAQSKNSIGIELSNYGWLVLKGNVLWTYTGQRYCTLDDVDLYCKKPSWRGYEYFATYGPHQYVALKQLLLELNKESGIPLNLMPEELRFKTTEKVLEHNGIATHVNFRKDKWDVSPAFDFNKII